MNKTIKILLILILIAILLLIIIFAFNPLNLRNKLVGGIINSYLENNIKGYTPISSSPSQSSQPTTSVTNDKHPLLNESQKEMLENFGVDVSQLPSEITPGMGSCFVEKLGQERANEIASGATPSAFEFFKAKDCIGK